MATQKATEFMTGKLYWAKVLGEPRPNYGGDAREWTFEFEPDEDGLEKIAKHKLTDRLKNKYEDRGKYITLKKSELNKDGNPNPPIRVYDGGDNEWDRQTLIGNGSTADVKLDIRDYGVGKKKGVYPVAIRVTDLVPYQSSEFGGMSRPDGVDKGEDAPPAKGKAAPKKDTFKEDFGLDDELPV